MIYTVKYVKKNSFFNKPHDIYEMKDGRKEVIGKYSQPNAPGSVRIYKPKFRKGKLMAELTNKEFQNIVKEMSLIDKNGRTIEKANMNNPADPFFIHLDLYFRIKGGSTSVNDEFAKDRFFLSCFKADPEFRFAGEKVNPALTPLVSYQVTKAGDVEQDITESTTRSLQAMTLLLAMSYEKKLKVLSAMGVVLNENPDPEVVTNVLYKKITEEANVKSFATNESNLDIFLRLAESSSEELNLREMVAGARKARIIGKKAGNKYTYGELVLGRNLEEVYSFMSDDENIDIRTEILKSLKNGKNSD